MSFLNFLLVVVLFSCTSNSEEADNAGLKRILQQSKWVCHDVSYDEGDNDHVWLDQESTTLYFTSDDAGVSYWSQKDYDSDLGNSHNVDYNEFTYNIFDKTIVLESENSMSKLTFSDDMLVEGDLMYVKMPLSSGDYELLKEISPKTGSCGDNLTYIYKPKAKSLLIKGYGDMYDYSSTSKPWKEFNVQHLEIEEGCTSIGNYAFSKMLEIEDMDLPSSLTKIGDNAFENDFFVSFRAPENLLSIGDNAFSGCKYLKKVYLNDNLENIGSNAFLTCPIKETYFTLPKNLKNIGDWAFMGCTFKNITLNDKLESIGNGVFQGVSGNISIPNSVTSIGNLAFEGTFSKVVIGTGLTNLSSGAFSSTYSGMLYVNLGRPLSMEGSPFTDQDIQKKWSLWVPVGSKSAYASDKVWKNFRVIYEDASLVSGNGSPEDGGETTTPIDYRNVTYSFTGDERTFKMVLVEGNNFKPFYIMQTEIPLLADLYIGDHIFVSHLDNNGDGVVIKSEFRKFIDDIRKQTGLDFRLPTTMEWQYAAKGGNKSKGYKYCGSNSIEDVAWYKGNSGNAIHGIALKTPNELGLYDMSGNYAEATNNKDGDIYSIDGTNCGGSWKDDASKCLPTSWELDPVDGMLNKHINNKGSFDGKYISIRLVFTKPDK